MQDVHERTSGKVRLGPGSLYWAIKRLVDANLLEETPAPPRSTEGSRRRYYCLTPLGRRVLKQEVQLLADIVRFAESKRLIRRPKAV